MNMSIPPVVLVMAGHDPTGGAGIQADIEAVHARQCQAVTLITALTAQNTAGLTGLYPQRAGHNRKQARMLLDDMEIRALKIGLLGSVEIMRAGCELIDRLDGVPVVLDPVLATGAGIRVADDEMIAAIRAELLPRATVLTPNTREARMLAGRENPQEAAAALLRHGCGHILLTGGDEDTEQVVNRLISADAEREWRWPRLPGPFHGSGCTLSAALAAELARGATLAEAAETAQRYTSKTLEAARRFGRRQAHPRRR